MVQYIYIIFLYYNSLHYKKTVSMYTIVISSNSLYRPNRQSFPQIHHVFMVCGIVCNELIKISQCANIFAWQGKYPAVVVGFNYPRAFILRTIIHDQQLEIAKRLCQYAINTPLQVRRIIVARHTNGNKRSGWVGIYHTFKLGYKK